MVNKILIFIITGFLFLFFSKTVFGQSFAGHSATLSSFLSYKTKIDENKLINLKYKEMTIRSILLNYNSPLVGQEKAFIEVCEKYQLDCYLLPSIAGLESTFGRFIWPNSYNPFGWGGGYIIFDNWHQAINTVGQGLKKNYFDKGVVTIEDIGRIYSENPTWAQRVNWFINRFQKEEEKIILYSPQFKVQL